MVTRKTISYGIIHFTVTFLIVWLMTGDILVGGAVALVEPAINTVAYFFHEKAWARFISRSEGSLPT